MRSYLFNEWSLAASIVALLVGLTSWGVLKVRTAAERTSDL